MASAKIIELDETNTCKICDNALAKYSCPKCDLIYCSLNCYQSNLHMECSETFYKDNVMKELSERGGADSKSKDDMLKILQRMHENNRIMFDDYSEEADDINFDAELDSDDDDDCLDIADRLAGINLDDAEQVWDKLTEDEKQEFVAFLKTEDVTKLIPSWQPWWLHKDSKIEEIGENFKKNCPKICSISDFSKITSKTPADCVKYNLINVISSYVLTTRYFNGEHFDFAKEAVSCVVSISLTLKSAENFPDLETAVKSVEQECLNSDWIMTDSENIQTMREDLDKVLSGPSPSDNKFYVLCALSDLCRLFTESLKSPEENKADGFSKKFPNEHFPAVKLESAEKTKIYIRKIEYFLSFSKDFEFV